MSTAAPWTVGRLLQWTADFLKQRGADSPRLDAEMLLAEALGCQRIQLYTTFEEVPSEEQRTAFRELVKQRAKERRWPISSAGGSFIRSVSRSGPACSSRGRKRNCIVVRCWTWSNSSPRIRREGRRACTSPT